MIFFSIVELFNKFLGLYITGYLARILSPRDLGIYLSALVTLGYAIEIGFFGSQNRHNADFALDPGYLESRRFAARRTLTTCFSLGAAAILWLALLSARGTFSVTPLLLAVACVPITFDYVAYGSQRSQLVVAARLASQLVAVAWIYIVAHKYVAVRYVLWGQSLQTWVLTFVVIVGLLVMKRLRARTLGVGVTSFPIAAADLRVAASDQTTAFLLRVLALALVSGELLLLTVLGDSLSGELATSLRLVQVIFPFVVFYVDSSVLRVNSGALGGYVRIVLVSAVALMIASPAIVVVLFGAAYAPSVAKIDAFLPAFLMQALLQYSIMVSLKERSERALLLRLLVPVALGGALLAAAIVRGATLFELEVIYAIKAVLFVLLVPSLSRGTRVAAVAVVLMLVVGSALLDAAGYYSAVTSLVARFRAP